MPNYRQKHRNRNRNRNRNKQQQQQEQANQQQEEEKAQEVEKVEATTSTTHQEKETATTPAEQVVSIATNVDVVKSLLLVEQQENETKIGNISNDEAQASAITTTTPTKTTHLSSNKDNDDDEVKKIQSTTKTTTIDTKNLAHLEQQQGIELSDTESVRQETTNNETNADDDDEMGTKNSKSESNSRHNEQQEAKYRELQTIKTNKLTKAQEEREEESEIEKAEKLNQTKVILHRIVKETTNQELSNAQRLHSPVNIGELVGQSNVQQNGTVKVIFHRIKLEEENVEHNSPLITSPVTVREYQVHSPTNEIDRLAATAAKNSYSTLLIQELSDTSLSDYNDYTPVVSEVESETESNSTTTTTTTQTTSSSSKAAATSTGEFGSKATSTASSSTQQQPDSDLRTRRIQKRAALENHFLPQLLSPRYLDSIVEENSDLSDARSDCCSPTGQQQQQTGSAPQTPETPTGGVSRRADARFPKSNLDFSRKHKHGQLPKAPTMPGAICEEPQAFIVETKEIAPPTSCCATATLSSATIETPTSESAELVFIDSASSSMSDLLEELANSSGGGDADVDEAEDDENTLSNAVDLDTDDVSDFYNNGRNSSTASECTTLTEGGSREQTPVNPTNEPPQTKTEFPKKKEIKLNDNNYDSSSNDAPKMSANFEGNFECSAKTKNIIKNEQSFVVDSAVDAMSSSTIATNNAVACFSFALPAAAKTTAVEPNSLIETLEAEMSNVRDVLTSLDELTNNKNESMLKVTPPVPPRKYHHQLVSECNSLNVNANAHAKRNANSQSPPPLPPPPTYLQENHFTNAITNNNNHTTNTNTTTITKNSLSLHDKQFNEPSPTSFNLPTPLPSCSIIQASSKQAMMVRQESADSHCSDSTVNSQCTAINLCAVDDAVDMKTKALKSSVSDAATNNSTPTTTASNSPKAIKKLRHLCTETLASLPYGEDVLVELANVAQDITEAHKLNTIAEQRNDQVDQVDKVDHSSSSKMPYPLPDLPVIERLQVSTSTKAGLAPHRTAPPPPPPARDSSWLGVPTEMDPKLLVCLSPAQRALIEKQQQQQSAPQNPDELLDAHQKYIDRRGYHEMSKEQVRAINDEKLQEQQILETAAIMKKLRKSLTPPPVPPPPVPVKSSETAAKAQNLNIQKQTMKSDVVGGESGAASSSKNDASVVVRNANDQQQSPFTVGENQHNSNFSNNSNQKHRLLAIIHDDTTTVDETKANESLNEQFATTTKTTTQTSSHENNSRQTSTKHQEGNKAFSSSSSQQATFQPQSEQKRVHFPQTQNHQQPQQTPQLDNEMQSMESDLARMFPTMGNGNIFDGNHKRFSNIETFSETAPFCSGAFSSGNQPKRYSNIETHSYESGKRIENGQVVYDYSDSKHESQKDGVEQLKTHFPIKAEQKQKHAFPASVDDEEKKKQAAAQQQQQQQQSANHVGEIMSALKLNTTKLNEAKTAAAAPSTAPPMLSNNSIFTNVTSSTQQQHKTNEEHQRAETHTTTTSSTFNEHKEVNKPVVPPPPPPATSTSAQLPGYEEFRQRAKAAADAIFSDKQHASTLRSLDHEKLFKDFDELSNQLKAELDAGKHQRAEREKSASLYDLSRMQMHFGEDFKQLKESRHDHMKELEREIERSMQSRRSKQRSQEPERTYEIPIKLEYGGQTLPPPPKSNEASKVHTIPIRLEARSPYQVTSPVPPLDYASDSCYDNQSRQYRRAESMYNLTPQQGPYQQRERSYSHQYDGGRETADDWSRYASDLGSSENITRPFAREVEICYQRQQPRQPRTIRAPRLTVSTNDISNNYLSAQTYDSFNAYNVRRTHAPMMSPVPPMPQKTKPQFLSCYSLLERDPNPTYIGTTTRRGVSPAPVSPQPPSNDLPHFNVSEREMRQRRASLPRELQEQQLKYIQSKEEELRTEFERLQNDRQRLVDEMRYELGLGNEQAQMGPTSPTLLPPITPPPRQAYRPALPKRLPTLSEDEVFRQQMAEEWLNKVAEREERRLQKIIKISKAHEIEHGRQVPIELMAGVGGGAGAVQPDIGSEFLRRVKERRTKLAMPADSDWESGAESQPQKAGGGGGGHASETEELPPVKVLEGKSEANLRQLPKHLREFAKFSNEQTEQIDGGQSHVHQEEERRQEATDNSFSSASKKTSVMKTVKITRQHPYQQYQQQLLQDGGKPTTTTTPAPAPATTTFATTQSSNQTTQQGDHHVSDDVGSACFLNNQYKKNLQSSQFAFPQPQQQQATSAVNNVVMQPNVYISSTVTTHKTNFPPLLTDKLPDYSHSTSNSTTTTTTSNKTTTKTSSHEKNQFLEQPSSNFTTFTKIGDHFADSPFQNKIFDEFEQFWQRINSNNAAAAATAAASNQAGIHKNI